MEQRLSMITLGVADLAASVRFYEDVVGWRRYKSGDDEEGLPFSRSGGWCFPCTRWINWPKMSE